MWHGTGGASWPFRGLRWPGSWCSAATSTVAAPTALMLTFSEDVNIAFTGVTITGPDKAPVTQGKPSLNADQTVLTVPLDGTLAAGTYTVDWHALSNDGHKTQGTYTFTVK